MRIDAYNQVQQLYNNSKINKKEETKSAKRNFTDQLMLSSAGREIQTAKQAVKNSPDIRKDLVDSIKERINNGTYEVDIDDFAGKLLEKYNALV